MVLPSVNLSSKLTPFRASPPSPISANVRTNHSVTALDGALASWFVQGKCQFLTARE